MKNLEPARQGSRIGRVEYLILNLLPALFAFLLDFTFILSGIPSENRKLALFVLGIFNTALLFTTSTYRIRDAGLNKWWILAVVFPLTSIPAFLSLCLFSRGDLT